MAYEIEEQHLIPQDISSYQFRLVGDMTLKQFLQIAAGALIALFLYASPLSPFIKWPLIFISVGLGVALAFLPIDDRPLATWLVAFFRSIYNPTIFVWKKMDKPFQHFQAETKILPVTVSAKKVEIPKIPQAITSSEKGTIYLSQAQTQALTNLEQKEENFLAKVTHLFTSPQTSTPVVQAKQVKPIKLTPTQEKAAEITETINITPFESQPSQLVSPQMIQQVVSTPQPVFASGSAGIQGTAVQYSNEGSAPQTPTISNVVVGQVIDMEGSIVEGAILEIMDDQNRPVRALKTNKLGHFMIVTPLMNGNYKLSVEKEALEFDPVIFSAEGKIIEPIMIKAKRKIESN